MSLTDRPLLLQRTALADSPAEECFDRLTRLARTLLNTTVAAISVPVDGRFLLKSAVGVAEPFATTRSVPSPGDVSYCHDAVRTGQPVIITDKHELSPDEPHPIDSLGLRSYAGVPLINSEGVALASFCVMDREPRAWTEAEIATLREMAAAAMTEIELRLAVSESARIQTLLSEQKNILEMIARATPLAAVLRAVTRLIEKHGEGVLCSIMLLEDELLELYAAPNLPEELSRELQQTPLSPPSSPCALVVHQKAPVISVDLTTDDRWAEGVRRLAHEHGIRSCWSTPIPGTGGSILGTFAMFYTEPRTPGPAEQQLVDVATYLAGIAIERAQAEDALRQRAEELASADRRKDEFLAMLSHELRNPLASIRIALQLQRRQGERGTSRTDAIMERQVQHLARLADDLLDVSRIVRGKIALRPERLELTKLIKEVAEDYRADIENKGLTLDLDLQEEGLYVDGDQTRLAQAVGNVLHNAVKFTDRGGRIMMRMRRHSSGVSITIEDSGIGMAPEGLRQVFQPFNQIEQTLERSHGGLGLGLTLVANLIELHGGRVSAESDGLGQGARFTITLPLATPPDATAEPDEGAAKRKIEQRRVLIIEDDEDVAAALQEFLMLDGHHVRVTHTGPAGVSEAAVFRPHVVICDLGLPGMDGYAVAAALRQQPITASARLIAFSGYGQPEDHRRSREHGFNLHLTKASDPATLLRAVTVAVP